MLDLLFKNVKLYDGTGKDAVMTDVGVEGEKIAFIGKSECEAVHTVDGTGLSLAPGFIDPHTHSDSQMYHDPDRWCKLKQGVTTELGGQCGWSRAPLPQYAPQQAREYFITVNGRNSLVPIFDTFREAMDDYSRLSLGAHQGVFVGHHMIRASILGMENRPSTDAEIERMKQLVAEAMEAGAMGLSSGLVYAPGCYAQPKELLELARVVKEYGGIYTTHMRDEADGVLDAVKEAITVARETGVTLNISHIKALYSQNWGKPQIMIDMIEKAIADGCNIFFDAYPYTACSATMLSTLPPSYLSHGMDWLIEQLSVEEYLAALRSAFMRRLKYGKTR